MDSDLYQGLTIPLTQFIETSSKVKMDNCGFVKELKRKCSKSTKKKNSEDLRFSTLSLMKKLSTDSEIDLISKLNSAISEDDLETIR